MKLWNFKVILADFWPKYLEAVAMATERQMSELALNFLVLPRKNHCQQFLIKSETEREQPLLLSYYFDPGVQREWPMLILCPICYP